MDVQDERRGRPRDLRRKIAIALMDEGFRNRDIAGALGVHPGTVSAWRAEERRVRRARTEAQCQTDTAGTP